MDTEIITRLADSVGRIIMIAESQDENQDWHHVKLLAEQVARDLYGLTEGI